MCVGCVTCSFAIRPRVSVPAAPHGLLLSARGMALRSATENCRPGFVSVMIRKALYGIQFCALFVWILIRYAGTELPYREGGHNCVWERRWPLSYWLRWH